MSRCSLRRDFIAAAIGALSWLIMPSAPIAAQTTSFTACTTGVLADCVFIQLTTQIGGGANGTNLFEIALRNLGSTSTPGLATSAYNLILSTGAAPATPGTEVDVQGPPIASGGATLTDASPWDVFESGDAIFISALSNNGIGGCVAGGPVGGFGQAGQTCGPPELFSFQISTPRALDPNQFVVSDLEVVGLSDALPSDSCGDGNACQIEAAVVTATPEPTTLALIAPWTFAIALRVIRRRRTR